MKIISKKLHLYLSIPSAIFIFIICITGAIMVFQPEMESIIYRKTFFTKAKGERLSIDSLLATASKQIKGDTITAVKIFSDPQRNIALTLSSKPRHYAYIDPYTGNIAGYHNSRAGFFHKTMTLHRWLMLKDRPVGKIIIGISTILMIIVLITGIVRWSVAKKGRFKISAKGGNIVKTLSLHRVVGFFATPILLIMAFTGLMWSFSGYREFVKKTLGVDKIAKSENKKNENQKSKNQNREKKAEHSKNNSFEEIFQDMSLTVPNYEYINISTKGEITALTDDARHSRATDRYRYRDGKVTLSGKYGDKVDSKYIMVENYAIHTGTCGGVVARIIWFIVAIIGAVLPITGIWLFVKFRR